MRDCVTDRDRQIYFFFRQTSMKKLDGNIVIILVVVDVVVESCYLHVFTIFILFIIILVLS